MHLWHAVDYVRNSEDVRRGFKETTRQNSSTFYERAKDIADTVRVVWFSATRQEISISLRAVTVRVEGKHYALTLTAAPGPLVASLNEERCYVIVKRKKNNNLYLPLQLIQVIIVFLLSAPRVTLSLSSNKLHNNNG